MLVPDGVCLSRPLTGIVRSSLTCEAFIPCPFPVTNNPKTRREERKTAKKKNLPGKILAVFQFHALLLLPFLPPFLLLNLGDTSSTGRDLNLVERVEKLEEDLRSSTTIIQGLSRQLEKLGIRFRLTRKALKEPIAEEQQQKQLELILAIGKTSKLWDSR
ncbi:uncharacterized protein LOC116201808 isoform X2 [Punica granatum]|uniref:Uncharacterized protein LOC116201808 isoform X2 n=1 Tax=Punica granatum TaxID=22663 RepID=A0A6P8D3R0_PUNGR|nr:uncharacterized protein LOC116201808 isoform X2 [Punica granatum]